MNNRYTFSRWVTSLSVGLKFFARKVSFISVILEAFSVLLRVICLYWKLIQLSISNAKHDFSFVVYTVSS